MEDHSQKTGGEKKREEARVSFLLLFISDSILGSGHIPSLLQVLTGTLYSDSISC